MNDQSSIAQDLKELFKKTVGANKTFLAESTRFIKQLNLSTIKKEDFISSQKQVLQDALNMFVKLSIQHTSNLIDLSIAISKRVNQQFDSSEGTVSSEGSQASEKPAFVLNVSGSAGTTTSTEFLLDSDKEKPITCVLTQTDFVLQTDPNVKQTFKTIFSPQSFELFFGKPQKVDIKIEIPATAKEGVYQSNIKVQGFEHTFFSLYLNITAPHDIVKKPSQKRNKRKPNKK